MALKNSHGLLLAGTFLALPLCAVATSVQPYLKAVSPFEVSLGIGPTWYHASNSSLTISPFETDSLITRSVSTAASYQLGVGYRFIAKNTEEKHFLTNVLLELNLTYRKTTLRGDVWQMGLASMSNYTFQAPLSSTRLLLALKPTFIRFNKVGVYGIAAVGVDWTSLSYQDTPNPGIPATSFVSLASKTKAHSAWDVGLGIRYPLTPRFATEVEYVYSNLGKIASSLKPNNVASTVIPLTAPQFTVSTQTVLFKLTWSL